MQTQVGTRTTDVEFTTVKEDMKVTGILKFNASETLMHLGGLIYIDGTTESIGNFSMNSDFLEFRIHSRQHKDSFLKLNAFVNEVLTAVKNNTLLTEIEE